MAPDFSYILYYLFGTQPDNVFSIFKTFGLLLTLAILSAAVVFYFELKRKGKEGHFKPMQVVRIIGEGPKWGNIVFNAFIGFILGSKLTFLFQNWETFRMDPATAIFSTHGHLVGGIIGGLLLGVYYYWQDKKQQLPQPVEKRFDVWPHDRIGDITVLAAISGVAGAKLFDILEHYDDLINDPMGTIFSGGGLAIYGGLIVAYFVVTWYLRSKKIPLLPVLDAVAPALFVGYGVGRMGCQLSGDGDWGIVNKAAVPDWWFLPDWLWSYDYPHNVLNQGIRMDDCTFDYCMRLAEPVYPTPIYETMAALALAGLLWSLRNRIRIPGMLFALYLVFNGMERFMIESIRVNKRYDILGFQPTQAEMIATGFILAGLIFGFILWRKHKSVT